MTKYLITTLSTAGVYLGSVVMANAQSYTSWFPNSGDSSGDSGIYGQTTTSVPEIDASTGLLAVAAVMASLALAWELKRRRAS